MAITFRPSSRNPAYQPVPKEEPVLPSPVVDEAIDTQEVEVLPVRKPELPRVDSLTPPKKWHVNKILLLLVIALLLVGFIVCPYAFILAALAFVVVLCRISRESPYKLELLAAKQTYEERIGKIETTISKLKADEIETQSKIRILLKQPLDLGKYATYRRALVSLREQLRCNTCDLEHLQTQSQLIECKLDDLHYEETREEYSN